MLNKQLILNHATAALIAQGRAATGSQGFCVYLNADGEKCAYGHLIDPKKYDPVFEGSMLYTPDKYGDQLRKALDPKFGVVETDEDIRFLQTLQFSLHDDNEHSSDFPAAVRSTAKEIGEVYKLEVPS